MASDSNSTASPPSSSKSQPPPPPPPPPPPSDDQKSPPSALPPPPSEQNSNSSSSTSPPPSGNGEDKRSSSPAPSPPLPVPSSQTSKQGFSSPPTHHLLSPPIHKSTSGSSGSGSGLPSSGDNGAQFDITPVIAIAAGAGILLLVVVLLTIEYSKKKKRSESPMYYYNHGNHADDHCKSTTPKHQQWNNGYEYNNGEQHIHFMPPTPGVCAKGWVITPPPPPQLHSSDMSNSSYSGPQGTPLPPPHPSVALGFNKSTFTFDELSAATGGFAQGNLLGQGGFGYVHRGVLPNGKEIAVKSLKSGGGQGDKEFQAEVEVINRVHHRHLVSLVGYCISEGKNLLVYEFVPNKTLEFHLHGKDRPVMEWSTRLKIAIGSAKGLAYLHEDCHPRIIHRDIKGPNILIDDNFEAKVADFGLAKFNQDNNTHISTRVMGTFGYMAPEYASSGKLTEKSDVFSFGVMLLELITGRPPIDTTGDYEEDSLVEWARPLCTNALENGDYEGLVDPRMENNYDKQEMARMVACAAASVRHSARTRPKMSQIVRALDGNVSLDDLSEGVKPGQSSIFNTSSGEYDANTYNADMKRLRKLALDSSYASDDFGGTSNELGAYSSSNDSVEYGKQTDRKPDAHSLRDL